MQKITPCLWFDGHAEEAARFYVTLLPDSRIDRILRAPIDTPGCPKGEVLTVDFTLAGTKYLGLNGGPKFPFTEAVSFIINCDTQEEVDRLWASLSEGGEEVACGWLRDRWGLAWQITPRRLLDLTNDPDPGKARRAFEAMIKMVKIDIAALERAADGS
jgi:predicted 3-demethylubiquinone-9 3-methyltransferase (glyoxalase superfamily)